MNLIFGWPNQLDAHRLMRREGRCLGSVPASSIAEALKSVMRTNRALAVRRMKVVHTTAMTTFRRRRSLGVSTASAPSSTELSLELSSDDDDAGSSLALRPCCGDVEGSWMHTAAGRGSLQTMTGVSAKATRFFRSLISRRMMDRRRQGSRVVVLGGTQSVSAYPSD